MNCGERERTRQREKRKAGERLRGGVRPEIDAL